MKTKRMVRRSIDEQEFFGKERIWTLLLTLAPPVMLAQLIQALYNIVDSLFIGRNGETGLTALSIIYPIQLLMIALGVGSGVGINTLMASDLGMGKQKEANEAGGLALPLGLSLWIVFAAFAFIFMPSFARISTDSEEVIKDIIIYGRIVCVGGIGLFLESEQTKVLQAMGDMRTPMRAQIIGALTNIFLDPIFIFGLLGFPAMGIAGAALATVIGQCIAAVIVLRKNLHRPPSLQRMLSLTVSVFSLGLPNIIMQSAYTFYIFGLNMILSSFSDQAVTALGLYYKWQMFFFIPLGSMQTCIVPVLSFNYAAGSLKRCQETLKASVQFGLCLMAVGTLCFLFIPRQMLEVFSSDPLVISIGTHGFHLIGISFLPMVTSLIFPVFFQAVGQGLKSSLLTIVRTVICFVPLGFLFSRFGLFWFWLTFPVTETVTTCLGFVLYTKFLRHPYRKKEQYIST